MPRLVRRRPLLERIKSNLDIGDWFLYLSESFETSDWDTKSLATWGGLGCNFLFLLARANSGGKLKNVDDVFGDTGSAGWLGWFARILVFILGIASLTNAAYTFLRRRHYRLFETPLSNAPSTPNASRVRVDSSPNTNSPFRLAQKIIYASSAASRAHPDSTRDVWELAIWDPTPFSLSLFQFFSPAHIVVYWLFLPIAAMENRPSIVVFKTLLLQVVITVQTAALVHGFVQQAKDVQVRNKEVMNEYDTKFVHPHMNPSVRNVGTQFSTSAVQTSTSAGPDEEIDPESRAMMLDDEDVALGTPHTILRRGWKINPNPNYASHISPDDANAVPHRNVRIPNPVNPIFATPTQQIMRETGNTSALGGLYGTSVSRQGTPLRTVASHAMRQPNFSAARKSMGPPSAPLGSPAVNSPLRAAQSGDGGSLGVYSHSRSPLKKQSSTYDIERNKGAPSNGREAARREIAEQRERDRRREMVHAAERDPSGRTIERGWGGHEIRRRVGTEDEERDRERVKERDRRRTFI